MDYTVKEITDEVTAEKQYELFVPDKALDLTSKEIDILRSNGKVRKSELETEVARLTEQLAKAQERLDAVNALIAAEK